jgi:hypothetical protein
VSLSESLGLLQDSTRLFQLRGERDARTIEYLGLGTKLVGLHDESANLVRAPHGVQPRCA